jgi:hypothetical protein
MQAVSGKIESKTAGVLSTPPSLINPIFYTGENRMTAKSISKKCSVDGCRFGQSKIRRGYCQKHQDKVITLSPEERFWSRLDRSSGECWEWTGSKASAGYGTVRIRGQYFSTHALAFMLTHGRRANGVVMHTCDNRACCRPDHLREGSQADNIRDAVLKGRMRRGEAAGAAILTEAEVKSMRQHFEQGCSRKEIALKFNRPYQTVVDVIGQKTWRHVI